MPDRTDVAYAPRGGEPDLGSHVVVREREGGTVRFHPIGGGFERRMSEADFARTFEIVEDAETSRLFAQWRRTTVGIDGEAIPAWVNGALWNGFVQPLFEKADVEGAIADGSLGFRNAWSGGVFWSDRANTFVVVETHGMPDDPGVTMELSKVDFGSMIDEMLAGKDVYERTVEGHVVSLSLATTSEIEVEGRKIEAFGIGDGWTWSLAEEPQEDAAPAPGI